MIYFRPLITKAKVDEDKYFPVYSVICCVLTLALFLF